jgi:hypothetical protein
LATGGWRREPRWAARLRARIGRRGALLAVVAGVDVAYGTALATTSWTFRAGAPGWWPAALGGMFGVPVQEWGLLWIVVGLFLLTGVPRRMPDWPHFAVAIALWSWWAFAAVVYGAAGTWGPGAIYAGMVLLVLIAAGWEDPP